MALGNSYTLVYSTVDPHKYSIMLVSLTYASMNDYYVQRIYVGTKSPYYRMTVHFKDEMRSHESQQN